MIAAVLVASGCGADRLIPAERIYVDQSIPATAAAEALAVWNALGASSTIVSDRATATVTIMAGTETDCAPTPDGHIWIGQHQPDPIAAGGRAVYIRMACYVVDSPASVIAHELGHVFYIGHLDDPDALMKAFMDDTVPPVLTDADKAAYRAVWQ